MKRSNDKILADLDALKEFLDEPRTMREMVRQFGRDRKTVFRWLKTLEARGVVVTRIGLNRPTRYVALPERTTGVARWGSRAARPAAD